MIHFHKVGKIKDAFGIRGDIYVLVFSKEVSWFKKLKNFSLQDGQRELKSHGVFEVQSVRPHKDGLVIHCLGVDDRNHAELMKGKDFCIDKSLLISKKGEGIFLSEILGFSVFEIHPGGGVLKIGQIESFSSNGAQDLLVVQRNDGRSCEIPFVKEFIQDILFDQKEIYLELPSGLLEIND